MSVTIPEKLSKDEYRTLLNQLKELESPKYGALIKELYRKPRGETDYSLKDGADPAERAVLDYAFRRTSKKKQPFDSLEEIARYLRQLLEDKKYILLFAYNGTGKTRLSAEFRRLGQTLEEETGEKTADTLYYNAFTEDLFHWDNDLEHDTARFLKLNGDSRFFSGLRELEMESRIRPYLHCYADFDFTIDYEKYRINFFRDEILEGTSQRTDHIKVSRGEENIFIWCFFLAIVRLVADKEEAYSWVKYIYIDDPISSLDDNHAIAVASQLAALMREAEVKVVVSTHHSLFYNVLCNEIGNPERLFFQKLTGRGGYMLTDTSKTPFFYHVALLRELKTAADSGELYAYHFNILRTILEKTASFHGYRDFSACLRREDGENSIIYRRIVNLLSHGNYSVFDPKEMVEENKDYFKRILSNFLEDYKFNPNIFDTERTQEDGQ